MKYALAAFCGMAITLCVFVAGVTFALAYLAADRPRELAMEQALEFPLEPVRVKTGASTSAFAEPDRPVSAHGSAAAQPSLEPAAEIENPEAETESAVPALSREHVAWCTDRYRSYRVEDNSYTPYSGGSRECISPFSSTDGQAEEAVTIEARASNAPEEFYGEPTIAEAADYSDYQPYQAEEWAGYAADSDHIAYCFARYRSYRPEDNSYQPFGGGPRRKCE